MALSIAISGAAGRMGRRIAVLAAEDENIKVTQAIEWQEHPDLEKKLCQIEPACNSDAVLAKELAAGADACIDFAAPESTLKRLDEAVATGTPIVIGTTGLDEAAIKKLDEASKSIAVLFAPNMSLGINVLSKIVAEVAAALGDAYDVEIVEAHHNKKADAPSGTALKLAASVCGALGRDMEKDLVHGRSGRPGERSRREIGMHALRMGSVVGEHTVHFSSGYERIELTHKAETRDVFAAGALRAAKWLAGKPAGKYGMEDVLFG